MQLLLCSLAVLGSLIRRSLSQQQSGPIILSKQVQNKYLVEGMDIVVKYGIYNIGDLPAVDVSVSEMGSLMTPLIWTASLPTPTTRIPSSSDPRIWLLNFTSAEVKYRVSEEADDIVQVVIISLKNYDNQFSAHILDWIAFAVITLPPLAVPFMLWYSSKSKYESIMKGSKKD
ncbi:Translocon-associated protein subunit beta [Caligus rogercresseyi]|uniref:Translocon-associated protein subunit beta n=1 Tax=Caligus rogercresseyi TaxID=217165 RepID=A0A7T8GYM1_CALRO|nr:Translocon-associated protein subunit beta [Caligus rogercresseyi]